MARKSPPRHKPLDRRLGGLTTVDIIGTGDHGERRRRLDIIGWTSSAGHHRHGDTGDHGERRRRLDIIGTATTVNGGGWTSSARRRLDIIGTADIGDHGGHVGGWKR